MIAYFMSIIRWIGTPSLGILANDTRVVDAAKRLVSAYYYTLPLAAYLFFTAPQSAGLFDPHWVIHWARIFDLGYEPTRAVVQAIFLAAALTGVIWHRTRAARVIVFVAMAQVHAFESSSLSVNTTWYLYFYTSFILMFLPDVWRMESAEVKRRFLLWVWTAQSAVVLAYTMAGCQKLIFAIIQASKGEIHAFSVGAFANQVANNVPVTQAQGSLASYVIAYPEISSLFYGAFVIVQFFSFWVMFRPALQRGWAMIIVLFHIGAYLTLAVGFPQYILIVSVLFFASPFIPEGVTWRQQLLDLPFVRWMISTIAARRQSD